MSGAILILGSTVSNPIVLADESVLVDNAGPATATYTLSNTGSPWLLFGFPSDFEARATMTAGSLTSGTTDTWLNLGTSRSWSVSQGPAGSHVAAFTLEIRGASSLVVYRTATISLEASNSSGGG